MVLFDVHFKYYDKCRQQVFIDIGVVDADDEDDAIKKAKEKKLIDDESDVVFVLPVVLRDR